ncbi:folliculin-interacting protein N-terminus-domain-containing protein [Calycina marina]|uniref:Folliculin-interacting protein N-terminus-domain-containing protein n=1 Tax=Calycina marina TaxID=1763456 RepID=A0A9P8CAY2_9HELO|nr:folliculin-interacting protein N-terminus-domain-containing protein [Calycina marina]
MSLLGKLFSGSATSQRPQHSLDSNLEDAFTHSLLFPDAEALYHTDQVFTLSSATVLPAAVNAFDINADLDLDLRDVRVIIMQEATMLSGSAYLLYDSHPPPPSPASPPATLDRHAGNPPACSRTEGQRSISTPRKVSVGQASRPLVIQSETPRTYGAFDRRPLHNRQLSYNETETQKAAREYREDVAMFSNCIFGNSEVLAYKGTGTKVHPLPADPRNLPCSTAYISDGSLGRSSMRSKLAQSCTSEDNQNVGSTSTGTSNTNVSSRSNERKKVLITRMFPVPLLNDATDDQTPTAHEHGVGYPFPNVGSDMKEKKVQPKQKRTPMYAVGLIIQLPAAPQTPAAPASRSFRRSGSYNEQESFPSSFNSSRRSGWTILGPGFGVESMDSSISSDFDDRLDTVAQHWDIITRTMSHLQAVATATLLPMLNHADITSPEPRVHHRTSSASVSVSGKRVEDAKPFKLAKTNSKMVQLTSNCLMSVQAIQKEVGSSRYRIISGIKALRVVTGQGRWGIWREEARTVGKWAGGRDEGFFFFNLLTGFLGNHTEWLQALSPSWYRQRHSEQHQTNRDNDISIPARTIIISDNKLMARRLIFLLTAFLPSNQQALSARIHRPSTSMSFGGYSQSPPMAAPILREESLRRKINKKPPASRAGHNHSRTMSIPAQPGNGSEIHHHHDRRVSDAASIKTANLPIPGSDIGTRKSRTATASTIAPVATMPHFSTRRPTRGTGPTPRPGSSGSLATDDLIRSLKRGDSTSTDSQGYNSKWGSMMSNFWSSTRRGSTADSSPPKLEGLVINDPHFKPSDQPKKWKLSEMVEELQTNPPLPHVGRTEADTVETNTQVGDAGDVTEQTIHVNERILDPSGAYESSVKTSVNASDGVIDIDVPLPDYLSFESAVSSPSSSAYSFSAPGHGNAMDGFEIHSRSGRDTETTMNVGGWLPHYNPDFALQAIPAKSNSNVLAHIKESLRAEPTPIFAVTPGIGGKGGEKWIDISSAIIADTTNFSIKHIKYRRLIKPIVATPAAPILDSRYGNVYSTSAMTTGLGTHSGQLEEMFVEEPIISMDDTLIDAVERIIAQSGTASLSSSTCSSRSPSRSQSKSIQPIVSTDGNGNGKAKPLSMEIPKPHLEVPRTECKKMVLTALEEIVRSVVDDREREMDGEVASPHERYKGKLGATARERESFLREGVRAWLGSVEGE